jgi:hypothetical protein
MSKSTIKPYKLTYNSETAKVGFVPQTEADLIETQQLNTRLNNILKDKTSESALKAKAFSDELKAAIERHAALKNK